MILISDRYFRVGWSEESLLLDALLPAGMELGADALAVEVNAASTLCLVGHPIALDLAAPAHQACGLLRTRRLLRHGWSETTDYRLVGIASRRTNIL